MNLHDFNLSTLEAEEGRSLQAGDESGLYSEFQASQGYIKRPCPNIFFSLILFSFFS